jgi:hypothetical protein
MDLRLDGKVALVTGGSKGIGLGIARMLAAEGARVAVAARDAERVRDAAAQIDGHGIVFDSNDLDAVPGAIADAEAALGRSTSMSRTPAVRPPALTRSASPASSGRRRTGRSCCRRWRSSSGCSPGCAPVGGDASSRSGRSRCGSRSRRSSSPTRIGRAWSRRSR